MGFERFHWTRTTNDSVKSTDRDAARLVERKEISGRCCRQILFRALRKDLRRARFVRRRELHAVAFAKGAFALAVHHHTLQAARIVGQRFVTALDREQILFVIEAHDLGVCAGG